jgi:hypothetical protein
MTGEKPIFAFHNGLKILLRLAMAIKLNMVRSVWISAGAKKSIL